MKRYRFLASAFALLCIIGLLYSCEEPDQVGKDILELPGDKIGVSFNDSTTLVSYSLISDSNRTENTIYQLLGSINDPIFGRTNANIYTQFRLTSNNIDFGATPTLDSIVVSLAYAGEYSASDLKKFEKTLHLQVFELDSSLHVDSNYYAFDQIPVKMPAIADTIFRPEIYDNVYIDSTVSDPQIRIRLDKSFGQKFLDASGTVSLEDNEQFEKFFKGLAFKVVQENTRGTMTYFNLLAVNSQMVLFYSLNDTTHLRETFVINSNCSRFTQFDHDYSLSQDIDFKDQIINQNPASGQDVSFLQSMGGIKTKIELPYIKDYVKDGKHVAVNRAELVVPVIPSNTLYYAAPTKLYIARVKDNGQNAFLPDQGELEGLFIGGDFDIQTSEYRFNISRYMQQLLNGEFNNNGLYLLISGSSVQASRVKINGPENAFEPMHLRLTYVNLDL